MAFPDGEDLPAQRFKFSGIAFVAFNISTTFILPEIFAGLGDDFPITAIMHMPETAVDEDDFFVSDKNDIGMAGKVAAMQGVTITHSMNNGTDDYFLQRCFPQSRKMLAHKDLRTENTLLIY